MTGGSSGTNRFSERVPPHDEEAEKAVLGSMLLDPQIVGEVLQIVEADHFYKGIHKEIFEAAVKLYDANRAVDVLLLREELGQRGLLEKVGGREYLASLADSVPSAANAVYYAKIVSDMALLRSLIDSATRILGKAYENSQDVERTLDEAEREIFKVAGRHEISGTVPIGEILKPVFDRIDDLHDRKGRITGLATGFYELDDLTCGLQPGELVVLASRPSIGKTSFALTVVQHVAVEENNPVGLFSLEMSKQQVAQNMLCSRAKINAHSMRRGLLPQDEWPKLSIAAGKLSQAAIYIDDSSGLTPLQIRAKARRLKAERDIKLVVVDYLQLMRTPGAESRQQEIAEISRSLKALGRELQIPVFAISQLNRAPEARESHRPRMADLRESGAIEQDADVVMLLHRDDYYDQKKNPGLAELVIAKQRNGPTGQVKLTFRAEQMRFESYSPDNL